MLKEKYQSERRKVMRRQTSGLEHRFKQCQALFPVLGKCCTIRQLLKDEGQLVRFCKLSDELYNSRVKIQEEIVKTESLIEQGARSTKVKSALPKVREMKDEMDNALYEQRTRMYLDVANQVYFSSILTGVERELQKATIEWIGYVDPNNKDTNTASENLEAEDATVTEASSETHDLSAKTETNQCKCKKNAGEKIDQSLKSQKSLKDTFSRDEINKFEVGSTKHNAPADMSYELTQFTTNFPSTIKIAANEPFKYQCSNVGLRSSQLNERRRLESKSHELRLRKEKENLI